MSNTFRHHLFIILAAWMLVVFFEANAQGIGFYPPKNPPGTVQIFDMEYSGLWQFYQDSTLLNTKFRDLDRLEKLDSTNTVYLIDESLFGARYFLPVGMDLEHYRQERLVYDRKVQFRKTVLKSMGKEDDTGPGGIELNIPVRIKSKAFQRIFGGDRVGLRVTGNITFELAGRKESREGSAVSSYEQKGTFSPRFKQTQQFQVEGKVGDKVSVKVDQNSEATFDLENTLKLTYTGDEDEIIQSIEAGNVSLNLPGTAYVSASSKHQGLFGLKTRMQVGNLSFVGIASLERGEKQTIKKEGGSSENTFRVKDTEYVRDRFFFADSIYQEHFESQYDPATMAWRIFGNGAYRLDQLDVWIRTNPSEEGVHPGWAVVDPAEVDTVDLDNLTPIPGEIENGYFKRLEFEKDYNYDEYRGFFWINQSTSDQDIVAIAYRTDGGEKKGNLYTELQDSAATVLLKLVKPTASKPEYKRTWKLAMRNVYNLGASRISAEGFDVQVLLTKDGSDEDVQPVAPNNTFVNLLGLDRLDEQGGSSPTGDKKIDANPNIFDLRNGYLIFPSLTPFKPAENSNFKIDASNFVDIYDTKDRTNDQKQHKFQIEVTTTAVSSNYNLGFNVLEGSEVVKLNGRELVKDKDYTIDYFGGSLQIITEEARRADANVEIEYERGSLFQLDKKTLLGGRLEYDLGDRGFIGFTALYLNKTTLDQRVRLGQEPLKNFIWDINTKLEFKPNLLTKVLDALPLVETSAQSKLRVEAEYAQVNPNPNTFNEPKLGENGGVAYIDDFEGSRRSTPLGITYRTWAPASIPAHFRIPENGVSYEVPLDDDALNYQMDDNRLRMFWYNPFNQVPIKDIWPNKDVNAQTGTTTNVLVMQWKNDDVSPDSAWGGIMRSTIAFPDQSKTKFIELWVKGDIGRMNVDLGRINEDFYIKEGTFTFDDKRSLKNLNTEDFNLNGLLDDGEDVGLDGVPDGVDGDDPFDNWRAPQETTPAFSQINGFENNGDAKGAKYPDTEDLDNDGGLSTTNEYFTYSFNLADSLHPYVQGRTSAGWRLYRIPLRSYNDDWKVGGPDETFREIFFVRLWLNDLPQDGQNHYVQLATFDFVGNEWEEVGVAELDSTQFVKDDSLFNLAVYNTEENTVEVEGGPEAYHSPPKVTGVVDRVTKARSKEQSLVMQLNRLVAGARAEAQKQLYEKLNLINYKKLKMFIHGDRKLPDLDSPLRFYMRFGPTETTYYEIGTTVYPHWDSRNEIDLVLDELAKTKREEFLTGDSLSGYPIYIRPDPENPEKYYKVVGKPSLRNINFITIGAENIGAFDLENYEIWLDELRVTNVERDKGSAMRLMADLTMADVATFRAQWEMQDANFRRIESQFGSGNTTEKQQYRATVKLHKFLPDALGLQIPISGGYVKSKNIPKYFFNSDQLTGYQAENMGDKLKQLFGMKELDPELEANSRISESKSLGTTIKRAGNAKSPWYMKYTLDMLTLDVDWSEKHASDEKNLLNDSKSINARMAVNVPFKRDNFVKPFSFLGNGPIIRALANQKVGFMPSSMTFNLSMKDSETKRQSRLEQTATITPQTTSTRKFGLQYSLFPSLNASISRDYASDGQLKGYRAADLVNSIFTNFDFGVDKSMNQNFSLNYNPRIFKWMTQSAKYTSGFNYSFSNPERNEKSSRLQLSKQFNVSVKPAILMESIYDPRKSKLKKRGKNTQSRSKRNRLPGKKGDESGESGQKDDPAAGEEGGGSLLGKVPNPGILVWKFFHSFKTVGFDYRITDNYNYFNIDAIPGMKHQLGFDTDPGVGEDLSNDKVPKLPGIKNGKNISGNIALDIIKNLSTTLKYNKAEDRNQNNQKKTESIASTYFFTGDDPEANKKDWQQYIPDWQIRFTGVEQWFFFKKYAKTIQLEHARSGKYNEKSTFKDDVKSKDSWGYSNNYAPLFGITLNTVWGVNTQIRYTTTQNYTYGSTGNASRSERSGLDVTMSYSKVGGFKLPLPFLNKKKLKNEVQFSLNVNKSNDVAFSKRAGGDTFEEQTKNESLKIKPSATYRFSAKVNGSTFFEYSMSKNKRTGKYSYFEFGFSVNIAIR